MNITEKLQVAQALNELGVDVIEAGFPAASEGDFDAVKAVAVRFAGPGLWGPIKGFLALEPDYKTIRGLTFYEQEETPGLGGDIVTEGFRSRFEGRQIVNAKDQWGIDIIAGGAEQAEVNEVAGISGATMTCDKVQEMINIIIEALASKREAYVQ